MAINVFLIIKYLESGIGREKGVEALENYLQTKTVIVKYEDYHGSQNF